MDSFNITNESIEFLKKVFKEYYMENIINLPERFGRREFGFLFFNSKGMVRHLSFNKKNIFRKFLINRYPAQAACVAGSIPGYDGHHISWNDDHSYTFYRSAADHRPWYAYY